jgi:DNA modification methylase
VNQYFYQDFFKNELEEDSFNLIFTDPPYKAFTNVEWDFVPIKKMWEEFNRLTEKNSGLVIFSNDLFMKDLFQHLLSNIEYLYSIVWKKGHVRNYKHWTAPLKTKEFLHFFMKGEFKPDFRDGTVKERYNRTGFGNKHLMRNTEYHKTEKNKNDISEGMFEDIWNIPLDKNRIHPTQKPRLFSERIKWLYRKHDIKVLDPFVGSGALLSAFQNGVGFDIKKWKNKKELLQFF